MVQPEEQKISLREYIDIRFDQNKKSIADLNQTLCDRLFPINDDLRALRDFMVEHRSRASLGSVIFATIIAVAGVALGVLALFIK